LCFFRCWLRPSATCMLFPYTTLFRSLGGQRRARAAGVAVAPALHAHLRRDLGLERLRVGARVQEDHLDLRVDRLELQGRGRRERSEEHTSELQSRENLVCRLLLEKKK